MDCGRQAAEIYSYAAKAPAIKGVTGQVFPNVKTVYVPQNAVADYKKAWGGYTKAEFKPLPAARSAMGAWLSSGDFADSYNAAVQAVK
jgi:hypothetical protein